MAITVNNPRIGWHTLAVFGTVTADQEQPDHPAFNLANPATYLQWRAVDNDEQSIFVALPDPQGVDYIGVYGHNWGSQGTTVHVEYSTDDGASWLPAMPPTIPDEEDRVFFREFERAVAPLWRVRLVPTGDLYDPPPEASLLYLGRILRVPRRMYVGHTPLALGRQARTSTGMSENGQFLGRVLHSIRLETGIEIANLDPLWVREQFDPFARASIARPFFWAWRPGTYPLETGLAWFQGELPQPSNARENGLMSVSFAVQGLIYPPHYRL